MNRTPSAEKESPWKVPNIGEIESLDVKEIKKDSEKAMRTSSKIRMRIFFLSESTRLFYYKKGPHAKMRVFFEKEKNYSSMDASGG